MNRAPSAKPLFRAISGQGADLKAFVLPHLRELLIYQPDGTLIWRERGVHRRKDRGRWTACIGDGGKLRHLGTFDTVEAAITARKFAEAVLGYTARSTAVPAKPNPRSDSWTGTTAGRE